MMTKLQLMMTKELYINSDSF